MNPLFWQACAVTAAACVALLFAEWREAQRWKWVAKPIASAGFVAAVVLPHAPVSRYGLAVLLALLCSWVGDVLLIPKSKLIFKAGIAAFLLGHFAFCYAFWRHGVDLRWLAGTLAIASLIAVAVGRWLLPHVNGGMRVPVLAYIAVITVMVACAVGTREPLIMGGALAFYFSDLSVARDRFVAPGLSNRLWGLPLYYGAQLVLAATARLPDAHTEAARQTSVYQGTCDGSAAVALDAQHFLDVSDEDQQLRVYRRGVNGPPLQSIDVSAGLGIPAGSEADFEGAARVGDRIYVVSSHGRDRGGHLEPTRQRLLGLDVGSAAPAFVLSLAGHSSTLLTDLLDPARWTTPSAPLISLLERYAQPGRPSDLSLAPEAEGLNIEGLAALPSPSQPQRLVLGLRNPQSGPHAILVTLLNADAMLTGAHAQLGEAQLLDLGGLGVRGMSWSPAHQALLILAGPKGNGGPFRIYKWDGQPASRAVLARTLSWVTTQTPEALVSYPKSLDVQVLYDAGDRSADGTSDGAPCKAAPAQQQAFTDQIVHID